MGVIWNTLAMHVTGARSRLAEQCFGPNYYDRRTQDWPLVSGRAAMLVVALYLIAVPMGKWMMTPFKPLNVTKFVAIHNLAMALLSLWMVVETLQSQYVCAGWDKKFRLWGMMAEPGPTFSPACYRLARVMWVHYLSKVWEFTDTFIMILKKNDRQISFLHVYHHATTFLCWWVTLNFAPGGDTYTVCAINSFVHVIMYTYYLISAAKVVPIPVAVKKSITVLQLIQFAFVIAQSIYTWQVATWYRPRIILYMSAPQAMVFVLLFGNFFRKAYFKNAARKSAKLGNGGRVNGHHANGIHPQDNFNVAHEQKISHKSL